MLALDVYYTPEELPSTTAGRVGLLLGLKLMDDIGLAAKIANGLSVSSAETLSAIVGRTSVVDPLIPEATLRRAKKQRKLLSREMSERLYEVSRVIDAVSRSYHGDSAAISRFLTRPHQRLGGQTPIGMAQSSSAGADAVINALRRADSGFAV